jgi:hypothetical protein
MVISMAADYVRATKNKAPFPGPCCETLDSRFRGNDE